MAEYDGKLAGYLRLHYLGQKIPYIGLILVELEHRDLGIGRAILKYLNEYLCFRGYRILLSSTVVIEPEPQEWHRKMGFEECGVITGINQDGTGELFFRKKIVPNDHKP